jgi:hypothetical protein
MRSFVVKAAIAASSLFFPTIAGPVGPPGPAGPNNAPQVKTTSGTIIGHQAPNRTAVTEFLGIQYGQAPVGALRFAPPKRYIAPAGTIYNASIWVFNLPPVSECLETDHPRQRMFVSDKECLASNMDQRLSFEQTSRQHVSQLHPAFRLEGLEELRCQEWKSFG